VKRDIDLVRKILFKIEQHEHGMAPRPLSIEGYTDEQVGYHVHLMGQAGLLEVADVTNRGSRSPEAVPVSMTWAGHEFLDAARSDTVWSKAKERIGKTVRSCSIEVMKEILRAVALEMLR